MKPRAPDEREAAFRELCLATHTDLLRFAARRVHPTHAEDVVADAWLVAWRRFDEAPRELNDARAWLYGVARNTILNSRRGERRRQALAVHLAENLPATSLDDTEYAAQRLDLARAWRRLSDVHAEVLSLTIWEGLTAAEAAQVLDISPVAVRLRLTRARRALRALIAIPTPNPTTAADPSAAVEEGELP